MGGLADLLATRREDIIQCFGRQLRDVSDAPGPTLLDSLPALLDALEASLHAAEAGASALARRGERPVRLPPDSGGLARRVREFGLLRDCLLTLLEAPGGGPRPEEQRALHRWLDGAVLDTVAAWEEARDAEVRRTAEYRDRFLGVAGHDLRNPLNAILLSASTLLRDESLPERTVRGLKRMATSAERLGRMIGELLDFTRGRLGAGLVLHRKPVDLGAVCRGVVEGLEAASPGALRLHTEGDVSGEWDVDRVTQLVGHLARSALDVSPKDTPVTLRLRGEADAVCLEVHSGAALSEAVLPVLFEPFHREARAALGAAPSGLGLGLYLARQLALAHGGTLEARSTPEEGTTFTVRLPRRAA